MSQESKYFKQPNSELHNEDYIRRVFESGTKEQLRELADYHKLSPENLKIFCHYAKLRRGIIDEMRKELNARQQRRPWATDEESSMGAYRESIEPQVRETVINLRKKGYPTYESGFGDFDGQMISFESDVLKNFEIPQKDLEKFKDQGVTIVIKPREIKLLFNKEFNQAQIKSFWRETEKLLPDLGRPAEPCRLEQARCFRENQELLVRSVD